MKLIKLILLLAAISTLLLSNATIADDDFTIGAGGSDTTSQSKKPAYIPVIPSQTLLHKYADKLFHNVDDPVGNANGTVTLVIFFDYRCIHSRNMAPVIDELIRKNSDLRVVFKALPIFGEASTYAAKAALGAKNQGKFYRYHIGLFYTGKELNNKEILNIAKEKELDTAKLLTDIQNSNVQKQIQNNLQLAKDLNFKVVPIMIIAPSNTSEDMRETPLNPIDVFFGETTPAKLQAAIDHHKPLMSY